MNNCILFSSRRWIFGLSLFLLLVTPLLSQAMVTTSGWDQIEWSISGFSDADFYLAPSDSTPGTTSYFYYYTDIPIGRLVDIEATCTIRNHDFFYTTRRFDISVPNSGTRYITRKSVSSVPPGGWVSPFTPVPVPEEIENKNRAKFVPYQKVPAYPDPRFQPDKWIEISSTGTSGTNFLPDVGYTMIYIISRSELAAGELKEYVDYEPEEVIDSPYGCNGCSPIGLPGFRIDMQSLSLLVQDTMFSYESMGPDVEVALSYNSGVTNSTAFGNGWRMNMDQWLSLDESAVTVARGDGGMDYYPVGTSDDDSTSGEVVVSNSTSGAFTNVYEYDPAANGNKLVYSNQSVATWTVFNRGALLKEVYSRGTNSNAAPLPMAWISDWNDNRVRIDRRSDGVITQLVDAAGRKTYFQIGGAGFCTNIIMASGASASFSYDGSGNLVRTVDLIGNATDYQYNLSKVLTNMSTEGRSWGFSYTNEEGALRVQHVSDPRDHSAEYSSLYSGKTSAEDFSGKTFEFSAEEGRKEGSTRPYSTTVKGYNHFGFPTNVETSFGGERIIEYDTNGLMTAYQNANNNQSFYGYTSNGLLSTVTNPAGGVWHLMYDDAGNVLSMTSPSGRWVQMAYDGVGRILSRTDANTNLMTFTYDAFGNIETRTDSLGAVTTFGYDTNGINLVSVTDANGNTIAFEYDENRRLTRTVFADGTDREYTYDCCAQTGVINERGDSRSIIRDAVLNAVAKTDYLGNRVEENTYDGESRLVKQKDALGNEVTLTYDALGRVETMTDARGNVSTREYRWGSETDLKPTALSFQDYDGSSRAPTVTFSYVGEGQLSQARGGRYMYDSMSRMYRRMLPSAEGNFFNTAEQIYYQYDADGLMTGKLYGTSTQFLRTFDAVMNLRTVTHGLGTDTYTPNAEHELTQIDYFNGTQIQFSHDPGGRLTNMIYPGGISVTTEYDVRNRPVRVSWGGNWMATQYDAVGCVTNETRSNGSRSAYTYNANSAMMTFSHVRTGQVMVAMSLTRNKAGQSTKREQTAGLTPMRPVVEQVQQQLTYTPDFEVRTLDGVLAGSDLNSNLTNLPGLAGFSAEYNLDRQPTRIQRGTNVMVLAYGDQPKPIRITENGEVRNLHYDRKGRLLFVTDGAALVLRMFVYLGDVPVAMIAGGEVYWYHYDQRGDTQFLTDSASRIAAVYKYLPYGLQAGSYSRVENPFTFAGRHGVQDLGEGFYNMGRRVYAAQARRFVSPDPVGFGAGLNPMTYANNNPIGFVDPGGMSGIPADYYSRGYARENPSGRGYYTHTPPKKSNVKIDARGCYETAENIGSALSKGIGWAKIAREVSEGQLGDALLDYIGMGIEGTGGLLYNFLLTPSNGRTNYRAEQEWERQQQQRNEERNKPIYITPDSGGYGGFSVKEPTFPPFTVD